MCGTSGALIHLIPNLPTLLVFPLHSQWDLNPGLEAVNPIVPARWKTTPRLVSLNSHAFIPRTFQKHVLSRRQGITSLHTSLPTSPHLGKGAFDALSAAVAFSSSPLSGRVKLWNACPAWQTTWNTSWILFICLVHPSGKEPTESTWKRESEPGWWFVKSLGRRSRISVRLNASVTFRWTRQICNCSMFFDLKRKGSREGEKRKTKRLFKFKQTNLIIFLVVEPDSSSSLPEQPQLVILVLCHCSVIYLCLFKLTPAKSLLGSKMCTEKIFFSPPPFFFCNKSENALHLSSNKAAAAAAFRLIWIALARLEVSLQIVHSCKTVFSSPGFQRWAPF